MDTDRIPRSTPPPPSERDVLQSWYEDTIVSSDELSPSLKCDYMEYICARVSIPNNISLPLILKSE